jgi:hypothetical protein
MRAPLLFILAILAVAVVLLHAAPARAASGGEKKKGGGESFLQFPALNATAVRPGGRRGVLTVEAGLDVPDGGLRGRAEASQPRLRDAYIRFLMNYAASVPAGTPPNPDVIATALQRATDEVLGKPGAKLLLGTVLVN